MNVYLVAKTVHILAVFALVGPLMLTPGCLHLSRHEIGRTTLHDLHRQIAGIAGWLGCFQLASCCYCSGEGCCHIKECNFSIALFLAIQLFDHFLVDRHEEVLERDARASTSTLKA